MDMCQIYFTITIFTNIIITNYCNHFHVSSVLNKNVIDTWSDLATSMIALVRFIKAADWAIHRLTK